MVYAMSWACFPCWEICNFWGDPTGSALGTTFTLAIPTGALLLGPCWRHSFSKTMITSDPSWVRKPFKCKIKAKGMFEQDFMTGISLLYRFGAMAALTKDVLFLTTRLTAPPNPKSSQVEKCLDEG